jgi:hypothetical protein
VIPLFSLTPSSWGYVAREHAVSENGLRAVDADDPRRAIRDARGMERGFPVPAGLAGDELVGG